MTDQSKSKRAFTLTELLVVLAIIIVLVAVSVPTFIGASKAGRLPAAVRTVQAALMSARNLAVAHNAIYSVELGQVNLVMKASPEMDLVGVLQVQDADGDGTISEGEYVQRALSATDLLEKGRGGSFVVVQAEGATVRWANLANKPDDYFARQPLVLPRTIAFAYAAHPQDDPDTPRWTAMPGWEDNQDNQAGEHFDTMPASWGPQSNGVPDIAFMPDGSCADILGETTIVLYDKTEEPDAEGRVSVAVIMVIKYTGEVLIETRKALLADVAGP